MVAFKLAYRNLIGAGLRTWLNVFVLSFIYILIIWHYGILDGWNYQAQKDLTAWQVGGGQYWHEKYDPYDPFTLEESHARIPEVLQQPMSQGKVTPMLITQATVYPEGRLQSLLLKGMDPEQTVVSIPCKALEHRGDYLPAVIGQRMADNCKLKVGDITPLRWRDVHGTFDAIEVEIVQIFRCDVPTVDAGQMYLNLTTLQEMMGAPGEATLFVIDRHTGLTDSIPGWKLAGYDFLMTEMKEMIRMKKVGGSFFYVILMLLAMLAIFDTQVLSIFRRQREIGTYIAMGMTRREVVGLFTVEGAMHAIMAVFLGAMYGIPFLLWQMKTGMAMPSGSDDMGLTIAERIFPVYGLGLILTTVLLVLVITTVVSYLPARKISKMKPTDAIKGKIQ